MAKTIHAQNTLSLSSIVKNFGSTSVLHNVNLDVKAGEVVALLGPSGCGKSTLLKIIAGFFQQTSGQIRIGEQVIDAVPSHKRNLGMVFQDYSLFPHMTIFDNVAFGLSVRGEPIAEIRKKVAEALSLVRLPDMGQRFPAQLSGGQKQRVAIARALVVNPSILLCDEPLSNLDVQLRKEIQIELKRIQANTKVTTIYVTHDQEEAIALADRIALMKEGKIDQFSDAKTIFEYPKSKFCAEFMGYQNFIPVEVLDARYNITPVRFPSGKIAAVRSPELVNQETRYEASFRSDRLSLERVGGAEDNGALVLEGDIRSIRYAGSDYALTLETDESCAITALVSAPEFENCPLAEGQKARFALRQDDLRLVAR